MNTKWSSAARILLGIVVFHCSPTIGEQCTGIDLMLRQDNCSEPPLWRRWGEPKNIALGFDESEEDPWPGPWYGALETAKSKWTGYASYVSFQDGDNIARVYIPGDDVAYVNPCPFC